MKICVAQIQPFKGNITRNIEKHKKVIALAASSGADVVFFPELSLTGYEPKLAKELVITQDDLRLEDFQQISDAKKIAIGVGVPTKSDAGIHISMLFFQAGKSRQTYSKQELHSDELPYFVRGQHQLVLEVNNTKIAPAICYESLTSEHAKNAFEGGAEIYLASVAKSANGIAKACAHYPEVALKYSMPVLMSNCIGPCDDFESKGSSAIWNKEGKLLAQLSEFEEGILVFDTETEQVFEWSETA